MFPAIWPTEGLKFSSGFFMVSLALFDLFSLIGFISLGTIGSGIGLLPIPGGPPIPKLAFNNGV